MKLFAAFAAAILICTWTAQPVAAQSALKRLEELIRGDRPAAPAESPPPEARDAGPAAPQPAVEATPVRGYLGVVADDRQDRGRGVRILEVRSKSPADTAGLKPQDLITAAGGVRVRQMDDLADVLSQTSPGEVIEFDVLRGDDASKMKVALGFPPTLKPGDLEQLRTPQPESKNRMPRVEDLDKAAPALLPEIPAPDNGKPIEARPDGPAEPPEALIQSLQRRIEQLERRVDELERRLGEKE